MTRSRPRRHRILAVAAVISLGVVGAIPAPGLAAVDETPQIVGGEEAPEGAYPFAAYVLIEKSAGTMYCGGSLISPLWVMTAAHCVWDDGLVAPSAVTVRMGVHDRYDSTEVIEEHDVGSIALHPQYVHTTILGRVMLHNDLALLRLDSASSYATVSIADPADAAKWEPGEIATIIGWGRTQWDVPGGSATLQEATVPVVTDAAAAAPWGSVFDPEIKIGAGGTGTDTCRGDSGGPLLVPDGGGGWIVAGVVSGGPEVCGGTTPALYTKVAAFNRWITGTTATSSALTQVTDSGGLGGDEFGFSVDIDGFDLVVGAPYDDHPDHPTGPDPGSFTVFGHDSSSWVGLGKITCNPGSLTVADSRFRCGFDVSLDGDTAVFGAPQWPDYFPDVGWIPLGEAFVVQRTNGTWAWDQDSELESYERNNWYGRSVAIDGDRIVVGAPEDGVGDDASMGAAFVYERSDGWADGIRLDVTGASAYLRLGDNVAIEGDIIALGSDDDVYIFQPDGGSWTQTQTVYIPGGPSDVALDSGRLVVGISGADSGAGDVRVYTWDGGSFVLEDTLEGPDRASGDGFGGSVAIDGERIVVGADGRDDAGNGSGAAYVFTRATGSWQLERELIATDGAAGDEFGHAVAVSGSLVAAGAPEDDTANGIDAGSVYVLDLDYAGGDTVGPIVANVTATPESVAVSEPVTITADIDERETGESTAGGATYSIDGAAPVEMVADDGAFDQVWELATAQIGGALVDGEHEVCVTGRDANANESDPRCASFVVEALPSDETPPIMSNVVVTPDPVLVGAGAVLTATIDDTQTGGSNIRWAHHAVSGQDAGQLVAVDGAFDSPVENLRHDIPPFNEPGSHVVCVSGTDMEYNTSESVCVWFDVVEPDPPVVDPPDPPVVDPPVVDPPVVDPPDPPAPPPAASVGLVDIDQGLWYLRDYDTGDVRSFYYGNPGDIPFLGDWDCDGVATPGLFRQSDAFAYLSNANQSQVADIRFFFGNPSDIPLAGDFNGDGCDTLSIYRPDEQRFYIVNKLGQNEGGLGAADFSFVFGNPGDKPVVGDWDGDGIDEIGLHRESSGYFYYRTTLDTGAASAEFYFGDPGDRFVAGDWGILDQVETPAVFRPSSGSFYFRWSNTPGNADSWFVWGEAGWMPVCGVID